MLSRDSIVAEEARRWIDSAGDRWRLQVLSRRVRVLPDGTRKEIPSRVRRFVEGLPWPYVKPAMDYLLSLAPYDGKIANGVDFETEYRPTITLWQRDAQSVVAGPRQSPADATYTLIQDLVENTDRDVYAVGSGLSCSEEAVTDYVWDAPDVEGVPDRWEQGVTYAVAAVHRNEDGTFDYQLVRRTAKTQHVEETVVRSDNRVHATVELFDNVYTDPVKGYVDETGAPLGVPEPSVVDDGTTTTVTRIDDLLENADCTLKFRVVRETRSRNAERDACEKTIFEHEHTTATPGNASPLGEAPDATGGVVTSHDSRLQDDGTYVNAVGTKTELPVLDSDVVVQVGRKGRRVTRTDRNQVQAAPVVGVAVGGRVEVKKTPGGLYDNTVSTFDETQKVVAGDHCKEDLFSHVDGETVAGEPMPGPDDHVEGGFDGKVVTRDVDMDEDGAVTRRTVVEQELPVGSAVESWTVTTRGVRHTVTDRNQSAAGAAPAFSLSNIGKQVENRRTPGGLYDVTTVSPETPQPLETGFGCERTVFSESDRVERTDPPGALPEEHQSAGGGFTREFTSRVNEDGTVQVVSRVTEEKEQESGKDYRRTTRGTIVTTTTRNTSQTASMPGGAGERQSHEMTPGGLFNLTVTEVEPSGEPDSARCAATVFEHTHDEVTMGKGPVEPQEASAGGGQYQIVTSEMDELGLVKTVVRTTVEKPVSNAVVSKQRRLGYIVSEVTDRNGDDGRVSVVGSDRVGVARRVQENPGGSFDKVVTQLDRVEDFVSEECRETRHEVYQSDSGTLTDVQDQSVDFRFRTGQIQEKACRQSEAGAVVQSSVVRTAKASDCHQEWESVVRHIGGSWAKYKKGKWVYRNQDSIPSPPEYEDVSCELTLNDFGLFDVVYTGSTLIGWFREGAGSSSGWATQGDQHRDITFYQHTTRQMDDGLHHMTRQIDAHVRYLWSTVENMRSEVLSGAHRPDLGLDSHFDSSLHCAVIYSAVTEADEWEDRGLIGSD